MSFKNSDIHFQAQWHDLKLENHDQLPDKRRLKFGSNEPYI